MLKSAKPSRSKLFLTMFLLTSIILYFNPPTKILIPITSRMLPSMDPARLVSTREYIPALTANPQIRISGTFPIVAFKNPPIFGPVYRLICSVESPSTAARGMMPAQQRQNTIPSLKLSPNLATRVIGIKTNSQYKYFIVILLFGMYKACFQVRRTEKHLHRTIDK